MGTTASKQEGQLRSHVNETPEPASATEVFEDRTPLTKAQLDSLHLLYSEKRKLTDQMFDSISALLITNYPFINGFRELLVEAYTRALAMTIHSELLENRCQAIDKLAKRLDFLHSVYLKKLLGNALSLIGWNRAADLSAGLSSIRSGLKIQQKLISCKIEVCDHLDLIYRIPLFLLMNSSMKSLWFLIQDDQLMAFTSTFLNPSPQVRKSIMEEWKCEAPTTPPPKRSLMVKATQTLPIEQDTTTETWPKATQTLPINEDTTTETPSTPISPNRTEEENKLSEMLIEVLTCPQCHTEYGLKNLPTTSTMCGHSICTKCLEKIIDCPKCGVRISKSIIVKSLQTIIEVLGVDLDEGHVAESATASVTAINEQPCTSAEPTKVEKRVDKSKLHLTGLPLDFTVTDVIEKLFKGDQGICFHREMPVVSLRGVDGRLDCLAYFRSNRMGRMAANRCSLNLQALGISTGACNFLEINDENFHQIYSADDDPNEGNGKPEQNDTKITKVVEEQALKEEPGEDKEELSDLNARVQSEYWIQNKRQPNKKKLFISGLPRNWSMLQVHEKIFEKSMLGKHPLNIRLFETEVAQNCVVEFPDDQITKQLIKQWNTKVLENDRRLLVEYYGSSAHDCRKNYAADKKAKEQPVLPGELKNETTKAETSPEPSLPATKKEIFPSPPASTSSKMGCESSPVMLDKKRLFVSGLLKQLTREQILRIYFESGKQIAKNKDGSLDFVLINVTDGQNCIVGFNDQTAAKKLITKWDHQMCAGNTRLLFEYFGLNKRDFKFNYGAWMMKREKENAIAQAAELSDSNMNVQGVLPRIRITNIPYRIEESFFVNIFDQKTINGVYVYIRQVNNKNLIDYVRSTRSDLVNGRCMITLNSLEAAKMIVKTFHGSFFPGNQYRLAVNLI